MIHTIDLEYHGTRGVIASYIIRTADGPVMIETGPANTTEALTRGLSEIGHTPADVRHVFVTHIHFDHAGASGWMAQHGAQIYAHSFGAPHLIDPSRLMSSARRIYGDEMEYRWGTLLPIPAEQVTALSDGTVIEIGGLKVKAVETPGHARHHHAYSVDTDEGKLAFTGDAGATRAAEGPAFIGVPAPPPEFELAAWIASVERLEREHFDRIYPTHFGGVDDPAAHFARVKETLREHAVYVRRMIDEGLDRDAMLDRYTEWFAAQARDAGVAEEKIGFLVTDTMADMNLTGITRYWSKLAEKINA